jgi:putative transposase
MRGRHTEDEILGFLRQAAMGTPVMDLCWNHCISRSTFRSWQAKYALDLDAPNGRQRPAGANRKRVEETNPR